MSRPFFIALAGFIVIAVAIGMSFWTQHSDDQASAPSTVATGQPPAIKTSEGSKTPSFDVVRINPQGETVIAGRAMPRAEVVILDGGKEIGRVIADNRGEWVFVPDRPLPPGSRELSLKATNPDGSTTQSDSPVVLVVPDRTKEPGASLAVKVNPDGSIEILQGPETKEGAGTVSISAVGYDGQGHLAVTGTATPKAPVEVYLDDHSIGRTQADDKGHWHLSPKLPLHAGNHTIRADQLGADGKVTARAEIGFAPVGTLPAEGKIVVEAGNSLWRIARHTYGSGYEYLAIYQANKAQIRDPNRIYPGQVFTVPVPH